MRACDSHPEGFEFGFFQGPKHPKKLRLVGIATSFQESDFGFREITACDPFPFTGGDTFFDVDSDPPVPAKSKESPVPRMREIELERILLGI
jgi:hypothetical protein